MSAGQLENLRAAYAASHAVGDDPCHQRAKLHAARSAAMTFVQSDASVKEGAPQAEFHRAMMAEMFLTCWDELAAVPSHVENFNRTQARMAAEQRKLTGRSTQVTVHFNQWIRQFLKKYDPLRVRAVALSREPCKSTI
mgnify:CR=1 FL=1